MKRFAFLVLAAALVFGLGGCALFNMAPAIVVSFNDDLMENDWVFFDASYSSDPENDDLDMSWSIVSAPGVSTASFEYPTSSATDFGPLSPGDYVVKLMVTDGTNTVEADIDFYVQFGAF